MGCHYLACGNRVRLYTRQSEFRRRSRLQLADGQVRKPVVRIGCLASPASNRVCDNRPRIHRKRAAVDRLAVVRQTVRSPARREARPPAAGRWPKSVRLSFGAEVPAFLEITACGGSRKNVDISGKIWCRNIGLVL
ncbi:MAG: hypothetical protein K0Q73_5205 [Paenibacillus sp.]|nr:hypothetical protein [Paenibacillus sp.]